MAAINYVKFYRGTKLAFDNVIKNSDTLYFITESDSDKGSLYLGNKLIAGSISSLASLEDVLLKELRDGQLLFYNDVTKKWENKSLSAVIDIMKGASASAAGAVGLVPAPNVGEQSYYLRGDGTWAPIRKTEVYQGEATGFTYVEQMTALNSAVGPNILAAGDVGIVKVQVATDKYQYTAYIYDGNSWVAMDGNYSSDSVVFDEDLIVTTPIGTITQEMIDAGLGSAVLAAKDKNVTEVLNTLFSKEKDPTVTLPQITIVASGDYGEVGSDFTLPTATALVSSLGNYSFGCTDGTIKYKADETGVSFAAGDVSLSFETDTVTNSAEMEINDSLTITATGANIYLDTPVTFEFEVNADYIESADRIPVTNLGTEKPKMKIPSGKIQNLTKQVAFIGYRNMFYGSSTTHVDLISEELRKLNASQVKTTLILPVGEGSREVIIAVPEGKKVTAVQDKKAFETDIFPVFELTKKVAIEGANNYTAKDYNVYVYSPATALGANTYTVIIENE